MKFQFHFKAMWFLFCVGVAYVASTIADVQMANDKDLELMHLLKVLRKESKDLVKKANGNDFCFKSKLFRHFDDMLSAKVISLGSGIQLVQFKNSSQSKNTSTSLFFTQVLMAPSVKYLQSKKLKEQTWFRCLALRLSQMVSTHFLQINLKDLTNFWNKNSGAGNDDDSKDSQNGEARFRRHRNNMIMAMMFGVTAFGAILVPIGFQLLSVVSGKALLLAKLALLLASVNGLKKVANSGLHYGLYHVPGESYGSYYDRGDPLAV